MKYGLCFLALFSFWVENSFAQQFAKAAVVSLSRIYHQFYNESRAVKEFNDLKASIQEEINKMRQDILALISQKQEVLDHGDLIAAEQLDKEIKRKQDEFRDFGIKKQAFLNQRIEEVKGDLAFYHQILEEIEQERMVKGANIVLNSDDPMILNYTQEADITDEVIARLKASLGH